MLINLIIVVLSYLLGSVPFGLIMGKMWKGIDIRDQGSRNAGFTNVYRVVGPLPAIIVLILDVTKGITAVLLLTRISLNTVNMDPIDLKILAAFFVILGHVFPIFAGFRGGKGIATGLGALISIIPLEVALALLIFVVVVALTKYVSLGSLTATTFVLVALLFERYYLKQVVPSELILMILFLVCFVFFNHRGNIKRLLAGKENKFGQKMPG
jgi:glycerol-3-phosphate acyltransferase PlsY